MKRNKFYLYILLPLFLSTGCKKFLAEKSQDEMTPQTAASLSELLAKEGYPYISTSTSATDGYSLCNFLNVMDDDVRLMNPTAAAVSVNFVKPFYTWTDNPIDMGLTTAFTAAGINPYQSIYNRIRGCNVVMDMLDGVTGTAEEKQQLKGEALVLRSYYYLQLVNLFGWPYNDAAHDKNTSPGVPLLLSGALRDKPLARNTVAEVYNQISGDIETASALLEQKKTITTQYRINYRSAWLLASRIFLYMEKWDKVATYTTKLINDYPIVSDLNTMKVPTSGGIILTLNPNFIDPSNPEVLFLFSGVRSGDWNFLNLSTTTLLLASNDLTNMYEVNDMRFAVYNAANLQPNFFLTRLNNYYMHSKFYGNGYASRSFRMSEAYMNRAEAYLRMAVAGDNSKIQPALDDMNVLRVRRFKSGAANAMVTTATVNSNAQNALQFCLDERRREFCFEEFRWFDLRRYGMPQLVHTFNPNEPFVTNASLPIETYTLPKGGNRYLMKLPTVALTANSLLQQNP